MPTDINQLKGDLAYIAAQRDRAIELMEAAQARADEWKRRYFKLSRDYSDLVGEVTMEALAPL